MPGVHLLGIECEFLVERLLAITLTPGRIVVRRMGRCIISFHGAWRGLVTTHEFDLLTVALAALGSIFLGTGRAVFMLLATLAPIGERPGIELLEVVAGAEHA